MKNLGICLLIAACVTACATSSKTTSGTDTDESDSRSESQVSEPSEASEASAGDPAATSVAGSEAEDETADVESTGEDDAAAGVENVVLTFDWPDGLEGTLEVESTKTTSAPGEDPSTETKSLSLEAHAKEVKDGTLDVRILQSVYVGTELPEERDERREYAARFYSGMWFPPVRVDAQSGAIGEVLDMNLLELGHDASMERIAARNPKTADKLKAAMDRFRPALVAKALAERKWNIWVGIWHDSEFELGSEYEMDPTGAGEGAEKLTLAAVQRLPCDTAPNASADIEVADDASRACVELYLVQPIPEQAVIPTIQPLIQSLGASESMRIVSVDAVEYFSVISDPDTLIPYAAQSRRDMTMVIEVDGERVETTATKTETVEFEWKNAPAPSQ